jgi:hypothetical protein
LNIDFHHATTYVLSRLAGFSHVNAQKIAVSAQYVDDATDEGTIEFNTKQMYKYRPSAHSMIDYRNFKSLKNHMVWVPFHFLPSGEYSEADKKVPKFIQRIRTKPNSKIAQEMVLELFNNLSHGSIFHQIGITAHVFADTWAHQNFVGINDRLNEAREIKIHNAEDDFYHTRSSYYGKLKFGGKHKNPLSYMFNSSYWKYSKGLKLKLWEKIVSKFLSDALPLGHGALLTFTDRPYLSFSYIDGYGNEIKRNNLEDFTEASKHLFHWLRSLYLKEVPSSGVFHEMNPEDLENIIRLFKDLNSPDETERYNGWLKEIKNGTFSFGAADISSHDAQGEKSWVKQALGVDSEDHIKKASHTYKEQFGDSDWKLFRDALEVHRTTILYKILPRHGVCVA